jgi:hypothetical protein
LRYLPERLSPLGVRVETALRERLAEAPSFVTFEGYDMVAVLADMLCSHGPNPPRHLREPAETTGRSAKSADIRYIEKKTGLRVLK